MRVTDYFKEQILKGCDLFIDESKFKRSYATNLKIAVVAVNGKRCTLKITFCDVDRQDLFIVKEASLFT